MAHLCRSSPVGSGWVVEGTRGLCGAGDHVHRQRSEKASTKNVAGPPQNPGTAEADIPLDGQDQGAQAHSAEPKQRLQRPSAETAQPFRATHATQGHSPS